MVARVGRLLLDSATVFALAAFQSAIDAFTAEINQHRQAGRPRSGG
jgi:hypothetical protein